MFVVLPALRKQDRNMELKIMAGGGVRAEGRGGFGGGKERSGKRTRYDPFQI